MMDTAKKIILELKTAGFEAYVVGGAVRDLLLGRVPHDTDVATSALPEEVKRVFERTVDTGIAHGTVLVLLDGEGIEVTTFRTEGAYTDHRRPDEVAFVRSLEEDLKRRDFTINAMAMTETMDIIDPFGGRKDLEDKRIRAVGNSLERFSEDALRMLRAIRFSGQLDFPIDDETFAAIKQEASLISSISIERVKAELDKMFLHEQAARSLGYLKEAKLNEHLPNGGMFDVDWTAYEATGNSLYGWAFMLHRGGFDVSALHLYKLSNDEKQQLANTLRAASLERWNAWTYYSIGTEALEMAAKLTDRQVAISKEKSLLPIAHKQEMAINGKDLMEWTGKKQGPWLKDWISRIERAIVFGELSNDPAKIKEWFQAEFSTQDE